MPLSEQRIKLYKGNSNKLQFILLDGDNKPLTNDISAWLCIRNVTKKKEELLKELIKVTAPNLPSDRLTPSVRNNNYAKTAYECTIDDIDTINLDTNDTYEWFIKCDDNVYIATNYSIRGDVSLYSEPFDSFEDTIVITDDSNWTKYTEFKYMNPEIVGDENNMYSQNWELHISDVLYGAFDKTMDTFAIYPSNYVGTIIIQGTNEETIPDGQSYNRWFDIETVNLSAPTEITIHNFPANFRYYRIQKYFKSNTNKGEINRILYRK